MLKLAHIHQTKTTFSKTVSLKISKNKQFILQAIVNFYLKTFHKQRILKSSNGQYKNYFIESSLSSSSETQLDIHHYTNIKEKQYLTQTNISYFRTFE